MPNDDHNDDSELDVDIAPEEGAIGADHDEDDAASAAPTTTPDLDPEIEQEIKRVIVEEEPVKAKGQMLPEQLINKELEPDDLFDAGSI